MRLNLNFAALGIFGLQLAAAASAPAPKYILLKSKVLPNQPGKSRFDGLELSPFIVLPGPAQVILQNPTTQAGTIFTLTENGQNKAGEILYTMTAPDLYPSHNNTLPYAAQLFYDLVFYAQWQPLTFAHGTSKYTSGFYINGTELLWSKSIQSSNDEAFHGWLACDWYFGYPQLFYVTENSITPSAVCAKISLEITPVESN